MWPLQVSAASYPRKSSRHLTPTTYICIYVLVCFHKWCVKVNMSVGMRVLLRVCGDVCCQCVHSCVLTRFNVYFTNCVNEPTPKHFPCFIVNIFTIDKWH